MDSSVEYRPDGTVRVKIRGRVINSHDLLKLGDIVELYTHALPAKMVLDFSECSYLDSRAIGPVLHIYRKLSRDGGELSMCGLNENLFSLFTTIKLDQIITLERSKAI